MHLSLSTQKVLFSRLQNKKWFYPLVYFLLLVIAFLPLVTEKLYDPATETQKVINEILQVSIEPYRMYGAFVHFCFILCIIYSVFDKNRGGRILSLYFSLNFLSIALLQTHGLTESYGYSLHTGGLVSGIFIAIIWFLVFLRNSFYLDWSHISKIRFLLVGTILLPFWSPIKKEGSTFVFDWDPLLLFYAPESSLYFCFFAPIVLYLTYLAWPKVDPFVVRVTSFQCILYGIFNLGLWTEPNALPMAILHLPLLIWGFWMIVIPQPQNHSPNHQIL